MKRLLTSILAIVVLGGVLITLSAATAKPQPAAVSMSYCQNTAYYPNAAAGLSWAGYPMYQWWTRDRLRAGNCGRVFVEHLQVYGAPSTIRNAQYRLVTYHADMTINYEGAWTRCLVPGERWQLKDHVSDNRYFRIFTRVCNAPGVPYDLSFLVAAGDATR